MFEGSHEIIFGQRVFRVPTFSRAFPRLRKNPTKVGTLNPINPSTALANSACATSHPSRNSLATQLAEFRQQNSCQERPPSPHHNDKLHSSSRTFFDKLARRAQLVS